MSVESQPLALDPLILPTPPSWFPLAWGWWAMLATAITTCVLVIWVFRSRQKARRAKEAALSMFHLEQQNPSSAIEIVRQAALSYFPREEIAQLSGSAWYTFLDEHIDAPRFYSKKTLWEHALYSDASNSSDSATLIDDCEFWLNNALPPKKRKRGKNNQ